MIQKLLYGGLVSFLLFSSTDATAQSFVYTNLYDTTSNNGGCDSTILLSIAPLTFSNNSNADILYQLDGTNYQNGPIEVVVNWGDGTSTTHNGQTTGAGVEIQFSPQLQHVYNTNPSGGAQITVTATSPINQSSVSNSTYWSMNNCTSYFYGYIGLDCDGDGQIDSTISSAMFDLIGQNGMVYTGALFNSQGTIQGIPPGVYGLALNSSWLANNGWVQMTISPNTLQIGNGGQYTFQAIVHCDSTSTGSNDCVNGLVFCDQNGNGQFDQNEIGINNAPVHVQNSGANYYTLTNNFGGFSQNYNNANQGPTVVTVNAQWLAQNGYYLSNNTMTVTNTSCNTTTPPVLFAVNCDSAQIQQECIGGFVFCDVNNNGVLDSTETMLGYAPIQVTGQNTSMTLYSSGNGTFGYYGNSLGGSYAVVQLNQNWLAQYGYTAQYPTQTVLIDCDTAQPIYFAINCNNTSGSCANMYTTVSPWIGYYQNQTNYIKLKWGNYGGAPAQSYTLTLTYPVGVTPVASTIANSNYTISGNTISWNVLSNSSYFSTTDVIGFSVPAGLPSGTQHYYTSTIAPTGNNADCDSTNNNGSLMMILGNSYDPNDKNVNKPEIINPNVQDELVYVIRFQNTGTAPAQDIYIIDTLSANLDWSTMVIQEASHDMQVIDLGNGVRKFNFPGIWLPDSTTNEELSHGQFVYKIKEKPGNGMGTSISNTAYIYFDWNPAIITNTTYNENNILGIKKVQKLISLSVYPNPVKDDFVVESEDLIDGLSVTDVMGNTVLNQKVLKHKVQLSTELWSPGIYFMTIHFGEAQQTIRLTKE